MPEAPRSLDHEAAMAAQAIREKVTDGKDLENILRRTVGTLQEQGVYAAILYLHAKEKEKGGLVAGCLIQLCIAVVGGSVPENISSGKAHPTSHLNYLTQFVTNDISKTLLVRHIWEQALVYGIYHCKI